MTVALLCKHRGAELKMGCLLALQRTHCLVFLCVTASCRDGSFCFLQFVLQLQDFLSCDILVYHVTTGYQVTHIYSDLAPGDLAKYVGERAIKGVVGLNILSDYEM